MSKENNILWLTYKLFCHNRGLAEGNLKTLEERNHAYDMLAFLDD